jgi:hypothetical protein
VVSLGADAPQPGATDLTLTMTDQSGVPVSTANVVVYTEMVGMGDDAQGILAIEESPGHYRAEGVPLSMAGAWQVTARISPQGQPTSVVRFVVTVGDGGA